MVTKRVATVFADVGKFYYICSWFKLLFADAMEMLSVSQYAEQNGISERTVRNWCATGKMEGAVLVGKTWNIPADAPLPRKGKSKESPLLKRLREEKQGKVSGGIYYRTQIDLTYNSNHIEGSRLTHEQTRFIFETNKIHRILKTGTSDSGKTWFSVGDYKKLPNEVGGNATCPPEQVHARMKALLSSYNAKTSKSLEDIIDLHQKFETIHPFQDGNGRVGRLLMFKECLANGIVPFIITEELKLFYYRGLREWGHVNGYLMDTCLTAQDNYKALLDYFKIRY